MNARSALVALLLAAAPALGGAPKRLASPSYSLVGVDAAHGEFYAEQVAAELASTHQLEVVTAKAISQLVGLERQRQLLGCAEDSTTCLAELSAALGAEAVLMGEVAQLGSSFVFTLKVIAATDAHVLAQRRGKAPNEEALLDGLLAAAAELRGELVGPKDGPKPDVSRVSSSVSEAHQASPPGPWSLRGYSLIPALGAVLAGVGAGLFVWQASVAAQPLNDNSITIETASQALTDANRLQTLALVSACVAGAALVTAIILFIVGAPPQRTPSGAVSLAFFGGGQ